MSEDIITSAFVRLRKKFLRFAQGMLPSQEDAEDALQDAFIRLWQREEQLETEQDVEAMTVPTLRHIGIDRWRRTFASAFPDKAVEDTQAEEANLTRASLHQYAAEEAEQEARERLQHMEAWMERELTPQQLDIIRLREYEERSYAEIASLLHMTETAVRMQLSRARKRIRQMWQSGNRE